MDPKGVKMGTLVDTIRNDILQDSHNILTESNDTDVHANDSLGNAHKKNIVLSPQVEVCLSQEMVMSHHNIHVPPLELSNPDEYGNDTSTRMGHSRFIIDPVVRCL